MYYNFPSVLESICAVDVEKFPYDEQTCKLLFGSWAYHGLDMDLQVRVVLILINLNVAPSSLVIFFLSVILCFSSIRIHKETCRLLSLTWNGRTSL